MSNSRRGLLAAGLAAAVVGSTGVVWTLNASAAEAPAAEKPAVEAPVSVAAPTAEPLLVPPKLLPWGEKPRRLKRAKPGANSAAVAAAGADAAPADTSGSLVPEPEFALKGYTAPGRTLEKTRTTIVPPTPPSVTTQAKAAAPAQDVYFHYAKATQNGETDGTWANLTIEKPKLAPGDHHTLAELALRSADKLHTVEVGWTVDRAVNGDSDPHLFVFHWRDGAPTCYNSCGFVQFSKTTKPGDTLPADAQKRFGIVHAGGAWWIAYNSEWIGYFPDKNWEGRFTRAGITQWFGEVASPSLDAPCSEMGSGLPATRGSAARIGSITMTNGPVPEFEPQLDPEDTKYYTVSERLGDGTFRYGGPGAPEKTKDNPDAPC